MVYWPLDDYNIAVYLYILHRNIDNTLVNSLHGLLNCEMGGLECRVITTCTEYRTHAHCIHMYHLICNVLVHVIYSIIQVNILMQYLVVNRRQESVLTVITIQCCMIYMYMGVFSLQCPCTKCYTYYIT